LGEVADYAALPDASTKDLNDWYITLNDNKIYLNANYAWKEANVEEIDVTHYTIYGLEGVDAQYVHGKVYGVTFVNALGYDGLQVPNASSASFNSISDHVYFSCTGDTINARITGNGAAKTITNSSGKTADIIAIDLTQMGALDPARANYYSELHEISVADWVDLTNQEIYDEIAGEYFVLKSVGFDEIGSKQTSINGEIFDIELHALNGYCDYLDTTNSKVVKKNYREIITVQSGAATLSFSAAANGFLFNDTGIYLGVTSGTSLTTSAADGNYTVIYPLSSEQSIDVNMRGIYLYDNQAVVWDSVSEDPELEQINPMVTFSTLVGSDYYADELLPERKIAYIMSCSYLDGENTVDVTDDASIGSDGYGIIIDGITADQIIQYEVELDDSFARPAFELYIPDTVNNVVKINIDKTRELKEIVAANKSFLDVLTKAVHKIGIESESHAISTHLETSFDSNNYKQIPDLTIYGQTILNKVSRDENFSADSNLDELADAYTISAELYASYADNEQRIYATEITVDQALTFAPETKLNKSFEDRLVANHKYLVYLEGKANTTGVLNATLTVTNGVTTVTADPWTESDTVFTRKFLTFTPVTTADWQLKVVANYVASTPFDYTFKNLDIIDITNLGELNAPMQEVFGKTYWYDLTDEQLKAYFDAVGHIDVVKAVGYSWNEGSHEFTINNYAGTPDSTPVSSVTVPAELHGWRGIYDVYCDDLKTTNIKRLELQDATIDSITKSSDSTFVSIETDEIGANHAFILNNEGQIIATTNSTSEASVEWDSSNESSTLTRI